MKKIVITGATGLIGRILLQDLSARGYELTVFTRNPGKVDRNLVSSTKIVKWDYNQPDEWEKHLDGKDIVVHLAGANLGAKRWNKEYKKLAYESRIKSTRNLVGAIAALGKRPDTLICSSAVGYYGNRGDDYLSEDEEPADNFLAKLCADWEKEAAKVEKFGLRSVSIRTGLVLSKNEGLLKQMIPSFKLFLGGYLGNGRQWFPWIHIDDIIGIYLQAIDNKSIKGPINAASPGIVTMKEFAGTLGKILKRPSLFPVPLFALKLVVGELGEYAVMSQRTSVDKILNAGYKFKFEELEESLADILKSD